MRATPQRLLRLLAVIGAFLALILLLTACSDDSSTTADSGAADSGDASDEAFFEGAEVAAASGGSGDSGDSGDDGDTSSLAPTEEPAADQADAPREAAQGENGTEGLGVPTALTPADIGRDIIFRATITVESDDVSTASREAVAIIQGLGGIVFGQDTQTTPEPRTVMTFKVLPADFATALDRLAGVGELVDQSITADDVTERIVDLQSRINTAEASVLRLQDFLNEANDINIIAQLENQLLERETTLETLRGQLRTVQDQVDLATITLTLTQSPEVLPQTGVGQRVWVAQGDDDPCLGTADIAVEENATVRFCVEVENVGEAPITDVRFDSEALRLNDETIFVVDGTTDRLESGEVLTVIITEDVVNGRIAGRVATRGLNIDIMVTGTPMDEFGEALEQVSSSRSVFLEISGDDALPGFGDSLSGGLSALAAIGSILLIAVGVSLPFVPFVAIIVGLAWWRRRRDDRDSAEAEEIEAAPPAAAPKPPPPPPDTTR